VSNITKSCVQFYTRKLDTCILFGKMLNISTFKKIKKSKVSKIKKYSNWTKIYPIKCQKRMKKMKFFPCTSEDSNLMLRKMNYFLKKSVDDISNKFKEFGEIKDVKQLSIFNKPKGVHSKRLSHKKNERICLCQIYK
jgi:hypothetical protein